MVRKDLAGIKLERTDEPLTGQGGFLAFGEYELLSNLVFEDFKLRPALNRPPEPRL